MSTFSFTLYPAHCRVGRGNLALRHSVPHSFCWILKALRVEWQNSTPRLPSTPEQRNENINLSKYFISSSGERTHNQSVLQSHFVPLRHDWPQIKWVLYLIIFFINKINLEAEFETIKQSISLFILFINFFYLLILINKKKNEHYNT